MVVPPGGRVPCNPDLTELFQRVSRLQFELLQQTAAVKTAIIYLMPKVSQVSAACTASADLASNQMRPKLGLIIARRVLVRDSTGRERSGEGDNSRLTRSQKNV